MITQSYTNNHIDVIYKLKILFYNFLYTNEVLSSFMQTLQTMLDAFNVSYMTATNSISIKLKKSCMRKLPNYSHTPQFYYQYFMPVFRDMYLEIGRAHV